jgi:hypothetical protein
MGARSSDQIRPGAPQGFSLGAGQLKYAKVEVTALNYHFLALNSLYPRQLGATLFAPPRIAK